MYMTRHDFGYDRKEDFCLTAYPSDEFMLKRIGP